MLRGANGLSRRRRARLVQGARGQRGAGPGRTCAKIVSSEWEPHSRAPPSMESANDMSDGCVSTPSSSNRPTRWGYVVRL